MCIYCYMGHDLVLHCITLHIAVIFVHAQCVYMTQCIIVLYHTHNYLSCTTCNLVYSSHVTTETGSHFQYRDRCVVWIIQTEDCYRVKF